MGYEIVTRKEWGAMEPKDVQHIENFPLENIVYHYMRSGSPQCFSKRECEETMRMMQKNHINYLNLPDIAFNFIIAGDGRIYEGRGWHVYPSRFKYLDLLYNKAYLIGVLGDLKDRPLFTTYKGTWNILEAAYKNKYVTEEVLLTLEDDYEASHILKELKLLANNSTRTTDIQEETKIKVLAADLRPSIDLSSVWEDSRKY